MATVTLIQFVGDPREAKAALGGLVHPPRCRALLRDRKIARPRTKARPHGYKGRVKGVGESDHVPEARRGLLSRWPFGSYCRELAKEIGVAAMTTACVSAWARLIR